MEATLPDEAVEHFQLGGSMAFDPYRLQRQTQAKHDLLRHYLVRWARVLSNDGHTSLMYIDGFSFAGLYTSDEDGGPGGPGSPLIALECFTGPKAPSAKGIFLFVDQKKEYIEELKINIQQWPSKRSDDVVRYRHGDFAKVIVPFIERLEELSVTAERQYGRGTKEWREHIIPTFVFVDPYGVAGFPMDLLARVLRLPRTEVFINLMWVRTAYNLQNDAAQQAGLFTRMFGSTAWQRLTDLQGEDLRRAFLDLYLERLRAPDGGKARFVRSFEMCGRDGAIVYWMVFCTNNAVGLTKMKEAMWKVDQGGQFQYRDTTNRSQGVLFSPKPDTWVLRRLIEERFAGKRGVTVREVIRFVEEETAFLESHLRKPVLVPMEKEGRLIAHRGSARAGSFSEDVSLDFLVPAHGA